MLDEEQYCANILKEHFNKKRNKMTEEEKEDFKNAKSCHICNKKYHKDYKTKHKDHHHFTGKYLGSAHSECNKKFYYQRKLNVFFHNLRGYHGHFLVQFGKKINIVSNNSEKLLSLGIGNVVFKDSYQFMGESLDELTKNLVKKEKADNDPNVFKYLSTEFKGEQLELLKKKGIFPYEYLNNFDRFNETLLPGKENFYSR